jgi:hypothetical protein
LDGFGRNFANLPEDGEATGEMENTGALSSGWQGRSLASRLSENPKMSPFRFARLPNLASSSKYWGCFGLDLATPVKSGGNPDQQLEQFLFSSTNC